MQVISDNKGTTFTREDAGILDTLDEVGRAPATLSTFRKNPAAVYVPCSRTLSI